MHKGLHADARTRRSIVGGQLVIVLRSGSGIPMYNLGIVVDILEGGGVGKMGRTWCSQCGSVVRV